MRAAEQVSVLLWPGWSEAGVPVKMLWQAAGAFEAEQIGGLPPKVEHTGDLLSELKKRCARGTTY